MKILRSVGAVVAGFVLVMVLALGTDGVLVLAKVFPPQDHPELYSNGQYALITLYTALYSAVGAYLTARLAGSRPLAHALVLGVLGTLASIGGAEANWHLAAGHEWYPIALILIALPSCWLGGFIFTKHKTG